MFFIILNGSVFTLVSLVMKKTAIKQQIQRRAMGRFCHLLDVKLAHNDKIAKVEDQQHDRVKWRVDTGVDLDENAKM